MGHKAQVTIQVCLEEAVYLARYREMQLESETMVLPNKPGLSVRADLKIRHTIVSNVMRILQQRKDAIESDLRKADLASIKKCEHGRYISLCHECSDLKCP